ncbi:MAG TPA: glycosyltransferase family 39 protein [Thermoanaerobaculia bacterium]|nr:glycosyltransferase family 39 protein [Thermoanaerobaculia bacterium]
MPSPVATSEPDRSGSAAAFWWRDLLLLALWIGILYAVPLGTRALWSPDEGRYAEIPREMVASGDWVTPRLDGVKYFEKPALVYWVVAASIELFGLKEWSVRLGPALLAILGCLAVYGAGRRLFGRRAGLLAAAVLATTPLYFGLGVALTLDMAVSVFLTAGLLAFLVGLREPPGDLGSHRRLWFWAFYACAALATLTKGLIGILIPGMVIFAFLLLFREWRLLRTFHLPSGIGIFLLIALPWHLLVIRTYPDFAYFYFVHEHLLRYATRVHQRYQPFWFFVPILFAGMVPWSAFLVQAVRRSWRLPWRAREASAEDRDGIFLLLWAGLVFAFFSFSSSKLVPYILPVVPPLALLIGRYLAEIWEEEEAAGRRPFWFLLASGAGVASVLLVLPHASRDPRVLHNLDLIGWHLYALAAALLLAAVVPFVLRYRAGFRAALVALAATTSLFLLVLGTSLSGVDADRSVKSLAAIVKPRLRPADEVMTYRCYPQDLPVYLERRVTIAAWKGELEFGAAAEDTSAWMIDRGAFWQRWSSPRRIYLVTEDAFYRRDLAPAAAAGRGSFYLLGRSGDNLLLTNQPPEPAQPPEAAPKP